MSDSTTPTTETKPEETKTEETPAVAAEGQTPAAEETKTEETPAPAAEGQTPAAEGAAAEGDLSEVKVVTNEENEETLFKVYVVTPRSASFFSRIFRLYALLIFTFALHLAAAPSCSASPRRPANGRRGAWVMSSS
jgi:hypothetical protein